jgi:hypothetical protein
MYLINHLTTNDVNPSRKDIRSISPLLDVLFKCPLMKDCEDRICDVGLGTITEHLQIAMTELGTSNDEGVTLQSDSISSSRASIAIWRIGRTKQSSLIWLLCTSSGLTLRTRSSAGLLPGLSFVLPLPTDACAALCI